MVFDSSVKQEACPSSRNQCRLVNSSCVIHNLGVARKAENCRTRLSATIQTHNELLLKDAALFSSNIFLLKRNRGRIGQYDAQSVGGKFIMGVGLRKTVDRVIL